MKNRTSINRPTAIKIMACNLLLCLVFLCGCRSDFDNQKGLIVRQVYSYSSKDKCTYQVEVIERNGDQDAFINLIDSCGKYAIGDTLWVAKKH